MDQNGPRRILAILDDLFFTVKIHEAAKRARMAIDFVKNETDVFAKASEAAPALIILDLNFSAIEPLKLIEKLKSTAGTKAISLIGYVSHVQGELKQAAQDAGCNMVLARSAFSQNLPQILKRHASTVI